ncbi:MAG TPA: hypothetical protein VF184_13895, partial [Phycisphaeraceae bacterium]
MRATTRQLQRIGQAARWLLVTQRLFQALAGALATLLVLGAIDYLLRLPAGLRLAISALLVGVGVAWLTARLLRAVRFNPSLAQLALRAERLYPQLRHVLASAVEFTAQEGAYRQPTSTAALAQASVAQAREYLAGVRLHRILNPAAALHSLAVLVVALAASGAVAWLAPQACGIALARWLTPWAPVNWPLRTDVESLSGAAVWPADTPLRLRAVVLRGHRQGMRVWVHHRLIEAGREPEPWQSLLMSPQTQNAQGRSGVFERLIDLPQPLGWTQTGPPSAAVEYWFEAGDDRTAPQRVELVARPQLRAVEAELIPPAYAAGLVPTQRLSLHRQGGQVATASALAGSQVILRLELNKPVPVALNPLAMLAPGLAQEKGVTVEAEGQGTGDESQASGNALFSRAFTLRWVLQREVQTQLHVRDEHELTNLSERRYRFEATQDQLPAVSLTAPPADEAVLPTAVVAVEGLAQDDVGVEELLLSAQVTSGDEADQATGQTADQAGDDAASSRVLARQSGRQPRLSVAHELALAPLGLQPGDVVTLTALARDGFELNGQRHEPVRSAPRRLRVIDVATFIGQLRGELAGVRQQAIRLDEQQRLLMESPQDQERQAQLTQRLEALAAVVQSLMQRASRNGLEEPTLAQLMQQVLQQLQTAREASADAAQQAQPEAMRPRQQEVRDRLAELIALLDQSRDALTLQLQLRELLAQQQALEMDTRRLLPQTIGRDLEQLPPDLRAALEELAQRQEALAEQAEALVKQMQSTAQALARQSTADQDRAAAEALSEAAALAQREGLRPRMDQSTRSLRQNQLSQAGQEQMDSLELLRRMLREMGTQEQRLQAMLRRRLDQLAQMIQRLIEAQQHELEALAQAQELPPLEPAQAALRRNTMTAQARAAESPPTQPAAQELDAAVGAQGQAIESLRRSLRPQSQQAQRTALERLEAALELVRRQLQEAQRQELAQARQELQQAYEKLAAQQEELNRKTQALAAEAEPARRQRVQLIALGHEEEDLRIAAADVARHTQGVLLFEHLHGKIDAAAQRVVRSLRRASADDAVTQDQLAIVEMLRTMAEALEVELTEAQFASGGSGSGAGGGGAGGQTALVPPAAQLRAL